MKHSLNFIKESKRNGENRRKKMIWCNACEEIGILVYIDAKDFEKHVKREHFD